ncbi:unnamed protein product, partial [Coregonus sp. 'balchen']
IIKDVEDFEEATVKESPVPPKEPKNIEQASTEDKKMSIVEDSPDKECPVPPKEVEDVEGASAQGQQQIQVDKDGDEDKDRDLPLPRLLDTLKKRFYLSRDCQIRARHWAQFRAETLRLTHQGIVVLQHDLELELERVREGLEGRRQRRERDHHSLNQMDGEVEDLKGGGGKQEGRRWGRGGGGGEGEKSEEEVGEEESEEESEDEEGDTEEEKVEKEDEEGSEEEASEEEVRRRMA